MKFLTKMTDGGPLSNSTAFTLFEIKKFASVILLRFRGESREVYHEHAFHCIGWVIKGELLETLIDGREYIRKPSLIPFFVGRRDYHKVDVDGEGWVFTIRGPWKNKWRESKVDGSSKYFLTHGRNVVD